MSVASGAKVVPLAPQSAAAPAHARLRGVTRVFQLPKSTLHALGPVDLDLAKGEFFSVVGPSGTGGVYAPAAGASRGVADDSRADAARRVAR